MSDSMWSECDATLRARTHLLPGHCPVPRGDPLGKNNVERTRYLANEMFFSSVVDTLEAFDYPLARGCALAIVFPAVVNSVTTDIKRHFGAAGFSHRPLHTIEPVPQSP